MDTGTTTNTNTNTVKEITHEPQHRWPASKK
jgi:hypothetical protein